MKQILFFVIGIHFFGCHHYDATSGGQDRPSVWVYSYDSVFYHHIHFAVCPADNTLQLKFPYLTVQPVLQISDEHGPNDVMISLTRGEFIRSADTSIKVTFDDKTPERWPIVANIETDDNFVVVYHPKSFIDRLKKGKYVTVETEIKDNGKQHMKFYVAGLKW